MTYLYLETSDLSQHFCGTFLLNIFARDTDQDEINKSMSLPKKISSLREEAFENNLKEGENAGKKYFLLFPQYYLILQIKISNFQSRFSYCLQISQFGQV